MNLSIKASLALPNFELNRSDMTRQRSNNSEFQLDWGRLWETAPPMIMSGRQFNDEGMRLSLLTWLLLDFRSQNLRKSIQQNTCDRVAQTDLKMLGNYAQPCRI